MRTAPGKEHDADVETSSTPAGTRAPHDVDACRTRSCRSVGAWWSGWIGPEAIEAILGRSACLRPPPRLNEVPGPPPPWRLPPSGHIRFKVYHRRSAP
jgi:hypothetical protein